MTEIKGNLPGKGTVCLTLFWSFFKITAVVVGGGYVILSAVEQEFVRKRQWITQEDFLELVAVSQTIPGIIACNGAVYLGYRLTGIAGALAAVAGTVLPPMITILCLASLMTCLPVDHPRIVGLFTGVNAAIVGMIAATAWRLGKKTLRGAFEIAVAAAVLTGIVIFHANPGWLMLSTIPFGIAAISLRDRLAAKKQEEPKS